MYSAENGRFLPKEGDKKGYWKTVLALPHHCHAVPPHVEACSFPFLGLSASNTTPILVMLLLMSFLLFFFVTLPFYPCLEYFAWSTSFNISYFTFKNLSLSAYPGLPDFPPLILYVYLKI